MRGNTLKKVIYFVGTKKSTNFAAYKVTGAHVSA